MTGQQIFDRVATHLIRQGRRSLVAGICVYRGADGTRCAIGALIDDNLMAALNERTSGAANTMGLCSLLNDERIKDLTTPLLPTDMTPAAGEYFLGELQDIHDNQYRCDRQMWPHELRRLADNYGLSAAAINGMGQ